MKKEIAINGRFLTQPVTGVQRYARELLRALDHLLGSGEIAPDGSHWSCYVPSSYRESPQNAWRTIQLHSAGILRGNLWEQIDLAWLARGKTLFSPGNIGPALVPGQVVTIHDASVFAFPQAYSPLFRLKYWLILSILGKTAAQIITISEFSKCELARCCRIPAEKISVVPHGSNHLECAQADETILDRSTIGHRPYLLTVGSSSPLKNYRVLAAALRLEERKDFDVVRVGGSSGWFRREGGESWKENVHPLGYVNDCELRALYEHSAGLIFPSKYEGFGMPVLEAMSLGCPVICSRAAAIPEVGGDAVLYFDPDRPDELKTQIEKLLGDQELQNELRQKGLARAKMFTWEDAARAVWKIIVESDLKLPGPESHPAAF